METSRSSIEVDVPPTEFYRVLIDFECYPDFVPNQSKAKVLDTSDDRWRVAFELQVIRRLAYSLDLIGTPGKGLSWTLVKGDMMKKNIGGWLLEETQGGGTLATYEIAVELKGFVPSSITRRLVATTRPANLKAFKAEAERRYS